MDGKMEKLAPMIGQLFGELTELNALLRTSRYAQARILAHIENKELDAVLDELEAYYRKVYDDGKEDVFRFLQEWG